MTILGGSYSAGAASDDYVLHSYVGRLKAEIVGRGIPWMGDFWMPTQPSAFARDFRGTPPFVVAASRLYWYGWGYAVFPSFLATANTNWR